jgi:FAD/FMN-containing dehydrogenase
MNPAVFKNVGFVTLGSWVQCKYAGVAGHEPDLVWAATEALGVDQAMALIKSATPGGASYTNEGHFGETNWQSEFWGSNYPRLLNIKRKYDPTNLFRVHHGVGSDAVS